MRLCIATPEYAGFTAYTGGIGTQYAMLAPALAGLGHEVVVLAPGEGILRAEGVEIRGIRGAVGSSLPDVDAVLAPEYRAAAWRLPRSAPPLVTHLHSSLADIVESSDWNWRRRLLPSTLAQRALERVQARRSDGLLSPTRWLLERTRARWGLEGIPAEVVPNGIDVAGVRRLAVGDPPPEVFRDGPLVVFSGRLEPRKGPDVLVRAMRRVWASVPEARLALLGAGEAAPLRKLAGEHAPRLAAPGELPPERLFPAVAAADVVALPSRWENFSVGALEAMALGRPVVATRATGFEEFVPGELLVPREDEDALADMLLRLLADATERRRLGVACAEASEDYAIERVAARAAAAVERLTRRAGA